MNLYEVIIAIALLLKTVAALVTGAFTSTPAHIDGVLTTCYGSQISITCNHNNFKTGLTRWIISPPMDCFVTIVHDENSVNKMCDPWPFTFQSFTRGPLNQIQVDELSSTAVAIANTSMTGSNVECRDSSGLEYNIIGSIILCIIGDDLHLSVDDTVDGVLIEWYLTTGRDCQRNINYTIVIESDTVDDLSNNSLVITTFGETRATVLGLIPNQLYTVQVNALVSSCESLTAISNFTKNGDLTRGTMNPNEKGPKPKAWVVPVTVCVTVIIVLAVIIVTVVVIIVIIKKSRDRQNDSTVKLEFQKISGTSELIYAKVNTNIKRQPQNKPKIIENEPQVQYSEIQQQAKGLSYATVAFSTPKQGQHTTRISPREPSLKFRSKGEQNVLYSQVNIQRQTSTGETNEVHDNQDTLIMPDQEATTVTCQNDTTAGTFSYAI